MIETMFAVYVFAIVVYTARSPLAKSIELCFCICMLDCGGYNHVANMLFQSQSDAPLSMSQSKNLGLW